MKLEPDLIWRVDEADDQEKILEILYRRFEMSGRLIRKLKKDKGILIGKESRSVYSRVRKGDLIEIFFPEEVCEDVPNEGVAVKTIYEDKWILAVDKPAKLLVHPTLPGQTDTLSNGIAAHMKTRGESYIIRHVNRLDRDTSGVVVIAKNSFVHDQIALQMNRREVEKIYKALVKGRFEKKVGKLEYPIGRPDPNDIRRAVMETGKAAATLYRVLSESNGISLVELRLMTGRTHQIRVHMAHAGHPVLGDELYGEREPSMDRQALHAESYSFFHPVTKALLEIKTDLPDDMKRLMSHKNFD